MIGPRSGVTTMKMSHSTAAVGSRRVSSTGPAAQIARTRCTPPDAADANSRRPRSSTSASRHNGAQYVVHLGLAPRADGAGQLGQPVVTAGAANLHEHRRVHRLVEKGTRRRAHRLRNSVVTAHPR